MEETECQSFTKAEWENVERVSEGLRALAEGLAADAIGLASGKCTGKPGEGDGGTWVPQRFALHMSGGLGKPVKQSQGGTCKKGRGRASEIKASVEKRIIEADETRLRATRASGELQRRSVLHSDEAFVAGVLRASGERHDAMGEVQKVQAVKYAVGLGAPEEDIKGYAGCERDSDVLLKYVAADTAALDGIPFRRALGSSGYRLFDEQKRICELVIRAVKSRSKVRIRYVTPPSGGKTSLAAPLGAIAQESGKAGTASPAFAIVYACVCNPVRLAVARMLVASQIPFAAWSSGRGVPSFLCYLNGARGKWKAHGLLGPVDALRAMQKLDRRACVHVCDLSSSAEVLAAFEALGLACVLFIDEPTAGAEQESSAATLGYARLFVSLPAICIVASATLPSFRDLGIEENESAVTVEATYNAVTCTAYAGGACVLPVELLCRQNAKPGCSGSLLRKRYYSPTALLAMKDAVPGLVTAPIADHVSCQKLGISWEDYWVSASAAERSGSPARVGGRALCGRDAHEYPGLTFVCVTDPIAALVEHCAVLETGDLSNRDLLLHLLKRYRSETVLYNDRVERIRKESAPAGAREGKRREAHDPSALAREIQDVRPPRLEWPTGCLVNSPEHWRRFHGDTAAGKDAQPRRAPDVDIDLLERCDADLGAALLCGCAVMTTPPPDADYAVEVLRLAEGKECLSFVFGDTQSVYGLDIPIDRVIVDLPRQSPSFLAQLAGRAGRMGKGTKAEVLFPDLESASMAVCGGTESSDVEGARLNSAICALAGSPCVASRRT